MTSEGLRQATDKMHARGVDQRAINVFEHYWHELREGAHGTIPEDTIEPLGDVPALDDFTPTDEERRAALAQTVVIKLNGGLGTSMGMTGPKSALEVRDGLTFLDLIARQVLALRREHGVDLPLILMDSFRTRDESLAILERYPELAVEGLPLDFLQNAEPKLRADDLTPVEWPADPSLEWCPPGHGDIYVALQGTGLLATLREKGIRYAFLSNADNLGATCDPDIAAWMVAGRVPYAAEVCPRTANDRKGGHLARRRSDGRMILRDSAMVVDGEDHHFQDNERHRYFHTNNLWVDLEVLERLLEERDGVLGLPIIINRKTVDPSDKTSPKVIQIESAMGTAVEAFEGSQALLVPRARFRPVKTTNELLLLRSDVFEIDDDAVVHSVIDHPEPAIRLDEHYKLMPDFDARFADGVPSMRQCTGFAVEGDVTFEGGVTCVGDVRVVADEAITVPAGTTLRGDDS
ncbi:UTP--glucose-1-phosphate uridylyltransferase [Janibacter sp. G56]|uniref:UTP--glucose-1-phosphate uridylyltransferase n=1 Tax=Janibacter sp. G56 TaxID=3418717 RepID=UPI003CFD6EC2